MYLLWRRIHRAEAINQSAEECISPIITTEVERWEKEEWRCVSGLEPKASGIFVIDVAIEEIRDYPQHWFKEAYFIAWLATKDPKSLRL